MRWLFPAAVAFALSLAFACAAFAGVDKQGKFDFNANALWWACYAAQHNKVPATELMNRVQNILGTMPWHKRELDAFMGLCYGA